MSLEIPELDDRQYIDIIEDARQRIPVYSETWTDHNASDPGVTLLELLAWVAETYTYQLDRITNAHRQKYLALLGEKPRPPRPASVKLQLSLPQGISSAVVRESTKLVATDDDDMSYGFETTAETTLTAAQLEQVVVDAQQGRLDYSAANEAPGMHYPAFGDVPVQDSKLYLGFDRNPFSGTSTLSLAVRLQEGGLPDPGKHGDLADSWTEQVGFEPSVSVEWQRCVDGRWRPLGVEYDGTDGLYRSGRITLKRTSEIRENEEDMDTCKELGGELFEGETDQWIRCVLKTDGYEVAPRIDRVAANVVPAEHRWTVEDEDGEPLTAGDHSVPGHDGGARSTGLPGQSFTFALSNAEPEARTVETLRRTFEFGRTPVLDVPDVEERPSDEEVIHVNAWERREDFDNSHHYDEHYVLDQASGTVRFGDGSRGKIPPEDARIATSKYVSGGGLAGNVPPSATWTFEGILADVRDCSGQWQSGKRIEPTIVQTEAATGGADAESIDEAFDRLTEDRKVPYRAVSLADYEYLATHTPGLRFGRAAARVVEHEPVGKPRPGRDDEAGSPCETGRKHKPVGKRETSKTVRSTARVDTGKDERNEAGKEGGEPESADNLESDHYCEPHREVRVVVIPYSRSSRPTPSDGFLDAVEQHLELHRLLTDWVTVERPTYVDVGVDVEVSLEPGYSVPDRETAIEDALKTFLDPLRGFEGEGWPFGRTLYRSELYEVVEDVEGVDCVTQLTIRAPNEPRVDGKGNLVVKEMELLSFEDRTVAARVATPGTNGRGK